MVYLPKTDYAKNLTHTARLERNRYTASAYQDQQVKSLAATTNEVILQLADTVGLLQEQVAQLTERLNASQVGGSAV